MMVSVSEKIIKIAFGLAVVILVVFNIFYERTRSAHPALMYGYKDNQLDGAYLQNKTFRIVMYNGHASGLPRYGKLNDCPYKNCFLTHSKKDVHNQAALLFFHVYQSCALTKPPILPSQRKPGQIWISIWHESPINQCSRPIFNSKLWENMVNWTMSYTYDSDIFFPFGVIRERISGISRNSTVLFQNKTNMAAWVVSNCKTQSKRDIYVKELQKHGLQVDIYGKCGKKRVRRAEIRNIISTKYKFYLAFENSFCEDYITEKLYDYFQLDVIIVVRGGGNYSKLLPSNAYINAADFPSAKKLAAYMLKVANDETLFEQYMINKNKYESLFTHWNRTFCSLCEKLNNANQNRNTYTNLHKHIIENKCKNPNDINLF